MEYAEDNDGFDRRDERTSRETAAQPVSAEAMVCVYTKLERTKLFTGPTTTTTTTTTQRAATSTITPTTARWLLQELPEPAYYNKGCECAGSSYSVSSLAMLITTLELALFSRSPYNRYSSSKSYRVSTLLALQTSLSREFQAGGDSLLAADAESAGSFLKLLTSA